MAAIDESDLEVLNPESDLEVIQPNVGVAPTVANAELLAAQPSANPVGFGESFGVGAAEGAVPFGLGSFADEAVGTLSPEASSRMRQAQKDNPMTFLAGNIAGAIATPDPIAKLKAVRNLGVLAKLGVSAGANLAESAISSFGEGVGGIKERIGKVSDDITTKGFWSLALSPLRALGFGKKAGDLPGKVSKIGRDEADAAVQLGQELSSSLSKTDAQMELTKKLIDFSGEAEGTLKASRANLGQEMGQLAQQMSDTAVNVKEPLIKISEQIDSFKPEHLTPKAARDMDMLKSAVKGIQESFVSQSMYGQAAKTSFAEALAQKQKLGQMIWDEKVFKDPDVQDMAKNLFFGLSKSLSKSDTTGSFSKLNDAFSASYKLQDAAEGLQASKIASLADPQSPNYKAVYEMQKIFDQIPEGYRFGAMKAADEMFNETLPELVVKARVMKKVTGRLPGEKDEIAKALGGRISSLSNFVEGNQLQYLNRLSAEQAGNAIPLVSGGLRSLVGTVRGGNVGLGNLIPGQGEE